MRPGIPSSPGLIPWLSLARFPTYLRLFSSGVRRFLEGILVLAAKRLANKGDAKLLGRKPWLFILLS